MRNHAACTAIWRSRAVIYIVAVSFAIEKRCKYLPWIWSTIWTNRTRRPDHNEIRHQFRSRGLHIYSKCILEDNIKVRHPFLVNDERTETVRYAITKDYFNDLRRVEARCDLHLCRVGFQNDQCLQFPFVDVCAVAVHAGQSDLEYCYGQEKEIFYCGWKLSGRARLYALLSFLLLWQTWRVQNCHVTLFGA